MRCEEELVARGPVRWKRLDWERQLRWRWGKRVLMALGPWFKSSPKLSRTLSVLQVIVTLCPSFPPFPRDGQVGLMSLANTVLTMGIGGGEWGSCPLSGRSYWMSPHGRGQEQDFRGDSEETSVSRAEDQHKKRVGYRLWAQWTWNYCRTYPWGQWAGSQDVEVDLQRGIMADATTVKTKQITQSQKEPMRVFYRWYSSWIKENIINLGATYMEIRVEVMDVENSQGKEAKRVLDNKSIRN